jgi:hypothetical protein
MHLRARCPWLLDTGVTSGYAAVTGERWLAGGRRLAARAAVIPGGIGSMRCERRTAAAFPAEGF